MQSSQSTLDNHKKSEYLTKLLSITDNKAMIEHILESYFL